MNKIAKFLIYLIFIFCLTGCSAVGKLVILSPKSDNNWSNRWKTLKKTPCYSCNVALGITDEFSWVYDQCDDLSLYIQPVFIKHKLYLIGPPIFPIIPLFISDEKGTFTINFLVSEKNNSNLDKSDDICVTLNIKNRDGVPIVFKKCNSPVLIRENEKCYTENGVYTYNDLKYYTFVFDVDRQKICNLEMMFNNKISNCSIIPLKFEIDKITAYAPMCYFK